MTGTGKLIRLILRRDRVLMPLWVVIIGLLPLSYISAFEGFFATDADRINYARVSASNAGFVGLYGQLRGDSLDEMVVWRAGFIPVVIGLLALLTVIRHTRTNEEAGRTELLGATVLGRQAQLAAALITTAAACAVVGLIVTGTMIQAGAPAGGSVWFGVQFTLAGWVFAGVAAVTAQLSESARSARGYAILALGIAWILRLAGDISAIGDGSMTWLSWLSPVGWLQHIYPYGANDAWPAVLAVVFAVAGTVAGVVLLGRRDIGGGIFAGRLGPASAAPSLRSPFALAWRLHRGLLAAWVVAFAALGAVFGGVGKSVTQLGDNKSVGEIFSRIGGADALADAYIASVASIVGIIAATYAVQATLRLRDEEATGHAEVVLSTQSSRLGWAASHLAFSLLGPAAALAAEGLTSGLVYGLTVGDVAGRLPRILGGVMAQVPAVWVLAAIAVLLFGLLPRYSAVAWAGVAVSLGLLLVGATLRLDQWVLDISPFTHVPHLPGGELTWTPLLSLTAIAVVLAAAGLAGLRRRDLSG
ncbi:ABC transporter permease [Actinoplanes sp. NPDC051633]|uniref:ABC transporter permease n=1 Tax=Actinoplanes sp. NPDC051633 TaxID=3155670 RepID=UPI003436D1F8